MGCIMGCSKRKILGNSGVVMDFEIIDGSVKAPWLGIVYGPGGCGKSWFASYASNPFYIPVEPGVNLIPARKFSKIPGSFDELLDMMRFVVKSGIDKTGKTIVIDSLGFIEPLIYADIILKNPMTEGKNPVPVQSISDYGFGRGYAKSMDYWKRILTGIDAMQAKGMNVLLITHSHYRNLPMDDGSTFKYIDMALQTFGDYSVPELLKRRSDWVYYMESQVQTRTIKNQFGGTRTVAGHAMPETLVYTRSTSKFYAKIRTADEKSIPDYYVLDRENLVEDSRKIFLDIEG